MLSFHLSGGAEFNATMGRSGGSRAPVASSRPAKASAPTASALASTTANNRPASSGAAKSSGAKSSQAVVAPAASSVATAASKKEKESSSQSGEIAELKASNEQLALSLSEIRMEMDGLEKERNFYFDKLRDIEMMLQDLEDNGNGTELTASIFKILYATAEGFDRVAEGAEEQPALPDSEGAVVEQEEEIFAVPENEDETF